MRNVWLLSEREKGMNLKERPAVWPFQGKVSLSLFVCNTNYEVDEFTCCSSICVFFRHIYIYRGERIETFLFIGQSTKKRERGTSPFNKNPKRTHVYVCCCCCCFLSSSFYDHFSPCVFVRAFWSFHLSLSYIFLYVSKCAKLVNNKTTKYKSIKMSWERKDDEVPWNDLKKK